MARIGIVTTWFERGAAYVSKAFREALEDEHEVFIYARGGRAPADPEAWKAYRQKGPRGTGTRLEWEEFEGWLDAHEIELVIFNEQVEQAGIQECKDKGIAILAYVDYYRTKRDFDIYDGLICCTLRHYGVFKHHPGARYIQWGTDVDLFTPRGEHKGAVFYHSAGFGGLNGRKGTHIAVEAARLTGAKLVISSQAPLIAYPQAMRDLPPNVEFRHETAQHPGNYHLGNVYVYPTKLEGIGLTVPEAMASGMPVIVTDSPPMSEFVEDGVTGAMINVERTERRADGYYWPETTPNVHHLASIMRDFIDNPAAIVTMGKCARYVAEERLDWSVNSRGLLEMVEEHL